MIFMKSYCLRDLCFLGLVLFRWQWDWGWVVDIVQYYTRIELQIKYIQLVGFSFIFHSVYDYGFLPLRVFLFFLRSTRKYGGVRHYSALSCIAVQRSAGTEFPVLSYWYVPFPGAPGI